MSKRQSNNPRKRRSGERQSRFGADPVPEPTDVEKKSWSIRQIRRTDWICLAVLLLVTLGFFWKGLIDPRDIIREDAATQYQPYYTFVADEITDGRFPHWNPYISCGVPFHPALQGAALYPLRIPLNWLSFPTGYLLTAWSHFFLTGAFAYLFVRVTLRCGPIPSLIGALSIAFGGFTLGHVTHPNWIQAYPWLILAVFLVSQAIERGGWTWAVAGGIPVALMAYSCGVHLLMVLGVGLAVWAIGETLARTVAKIRGDSRSPWWVLSPVLMIGLTVVLGGAIGMAQLWAGLYQSARSLRTEATWEFITEFCSHPARAALRLVVPFYYGNYRLGYWGENNFHGQCFYAGIVPLFGAFMAVPLWRGNRWAPRLLVFTLVVGVIAAGRFLPVYRLLYDHLPLFGSLRNPSRFFGLVQFAIASLGAIGLDAAFKAASKPSEKLKTMAPIVVGVGLLGVMIVSLVKIHHLSHDPTPGIEFIRKLDNISESDRLKAENAVRTMSQKVFREGDPVTWIGVAAGLGSVIACTGFFTFQKLHRPVFGCLLGGLLVLDLGMFSGGMLHYTEVDKGNISAVVTETPQHVRFLQKNLGMQRFICWGWHRTNLDRFRGMQFRIRHTIINRGGTFHTPRQWRVILTGWGGNRRVLDLIGVRYLVTNRPIRGKDLRPAYHENPVFITENLQAFPPAFLTRKVRIFDDPNNVFKELTTGRENLRDTALLEKQIAPLPGDGDPAIPPGEVSHIGEDVPGRYSMHVSVPEARQLVLTETYHPQWKCTIDGVEIPVYLTDYAFMSVRIPAGEHEVQWHFEPTRFKQGLAVTLTASALTLGLLIFAWFRRHQKRPMISNKPGTTGQQPR